MKIRVYYEDTDCGNVVYYANYLKYMERGRTEYMRERGIDLEEFHRKGYLFAVAEVNVKYRRSARYNDLLDMETKIIELTSVTMTFETTIYNERGELIVTGTAKMVCISAANGKSCRAPNEMIEAFS